MAERSRQFFVTHVGTVIVNNFGAVSFEANAGAKVIVADSTVYAIAKGVREAVREFKAEGVWREDAK